MLAFGVETIVLLSLAYLLGCAAGCVSRRIVGVPRHWPTIEGTVAPRQVTTVAAPQPRRGTAVPEPIARARAEPARDAFRRADTLFPAPSLLEGAASAWNGGAENPADLQGTITRFETALDGLGRNSTPPPAPLLPTTRAAPASLHDDFEQDLKLVRGIGALLELKLKAAGITRYDQIAAWTAADVARISAKFSLRDRIEQERWIEQARGLAGYAEALPHVVSATSAVLRHEDRAAQPIVDPVPAREPSEGP